MREPVLNQNVIIITGATMGIGRELALQLSDQGAWLALGSRNAEKLAEVAQECSQRGGRAISIPTDVAYQTQCQNLIEATAAEYGRIDTLINNAGISDTAKFVDLKDFVTFEKVIQVNFWGSVYCTHYALPYLKTSAGRLVCISSQRGIFPSARADGYGTSKHALAGFFNSLRNELAESGVSVTTIYPSWVNTGITSRSLRPDGTVTGKISKHEQGAMPVDVCARRIIQAIARRKREDVMTFQGKAGLWLRLILPGVVDQIAKKESE